MKKIILIFSAFLALSTSCNKADLNDSNFPIEKLEESGEELLGINLQNLPTYITQTESLISSNSNLVNLLSTDFITTKIQNANIGILSLNYTKVYNSNIGAFSYVVKLLNENNDENALVILPIDESRKIYSVFMVKYMLVNGINTSFISQLDSRQDFNFLPAAEKITKTKAWWKDCISKGYATLTNDLAGQLAWATNTAVCLAAIILDCALQGIPPNMNQTDLINWLCSQGIIECAYTINQNSISFVSLTL